METEIDSLIFACMYVHVKLLGLFDAGTALLFIHFFTQNVNIHALWFWRVCERAYVWLCLPMWWKWACV